MSTCPRCGRDRAVTGMEGTGYCRADFGGIVAVLACRNASEAYRRGLADMLAIAKEHAYVLGVGARISWSDVDAEAAKRMEG